MPESSLHHFPFAPVDIADCHDKRENLCMGLTVNDTVTASVDLPSEAIKMPLQGHVVTCAFPAA